ncbi:MAG TPA: hypothetical protein VFT74_08945 [Isosphaeraceae bacterium]|nr:hypothetical protein [Isosphaeraceae bacterium]
MFATLLTVMMVAQTGPIRLHPDNPRYFLFAGKPTVLVTSGEHYGAVLNQDFDVEPYLDELQRRGFNLTRTFSGTYREIPGSFKIQANTLAPAPGRYQAPWVREGETYDLDHLDPAFFERLKSVVSEAAERGIVVEYVLFCPFYDDNLWAVNPMNAKNNGNGVGRCPREEVYTLKHPDLLKRQVAFVERAVKELNEFDNLYFEICNEPYFGGVTLDWQKVIAQVIVETEKTLPKKHLIAQNIANGKAKVESPDPAVSIFNFHYASPPETVALNWNLKRPIGFDETGFKGTGDRVYRTQAWEFLLAGGSVFDHLDYSFTTDHEDGTAEVKAPTPGGGGPTFRAQLSILKHFLDDFDLVKMAPDETSITPDGGSWDNNPLYVLSEPGRQYAAYVRGGKNLEVRLNLPAGSYHYEWMNPLDGSSLGQGDLNVRQGNAVKLKPADFPEDLALSLRRR